MTTKHFYNLIKDELWANGMEYNPYLETIHGPTFSIMVADNTIRFSRDYTPSPEYLDLRDPESLGRLEHHVRNAWGCSI